MSFQTQREIEWIMNRMGEEMTFNYCAALLSFNHFYYGYIYTNTEKRDEKMIYL